MNQNSSDPPRSYLSDSPSEGRVKRPTPVTVIAWLLISLCALNLLSMAIGYWTPLAHHFFFAHSGTSDSVNLASGVIGMLATIVFAAYMLRGASWARWAYLAWASFGVVSLVFLASSMLYVLPGAIKTLIIGYFLTRRDARVFFSARHPAPRNGSDRAA
jgi:hypothetical protein